jgi:hypothetical protein
METAMHARENVWHGEFEDVPEGVWRTPCGWYKIIRDDNPATLQHSISSNACECLFCEKLRTRSAHARRRAARATMFESLKERLISLYRLDSQAKRRKIQVEHINIVLGDKLGRWLESERKTYLASTGGDGDLEGLLAHLRTKVGSDVIWKMIIDTFWATRQYGRGAPD